jgi:hypothetical protein
MKAVREEERSELKVMLKGFQGNDFGAFFHSLGGREKNLVFKDKKLD